MLSSLTCENELVRMSCRPKRLDDRTCLRMHAQSHAGWSLHLLYACHTNAARSHDTGRSWTSWVAKSMNIFTRNSFQWNVRFYLLVYNVSTFSSWYNERRPHESFITLCKMLLSPRVARFHWRVHIVNEYIRVPAHYAQHSKIKKKKRKLKKTDKTADSMATSN